MRRKHRKDQKHSKQGFIGGNPRYSDKQGIAHPKRSAKFQQKIEREEMTV